MRHPAYRTLPDEAIEPTSTPPGTRYLEQCEALRELRTLHNAISAAQLSRDERLATLARTGIVSRRDMARACGLNKSRVDQILTRVSRRSEASNASRHR